MQPKEFLTKAVEAARAANHVWPEYAAAEAALESGWGESALAKQANNLFGCKQHKSAVYGTIAMPTREFERPGVDLDGDGVTGEGWVKALADWVQYPDWSACFTDRMNTLQRMSAYKPALQATTGEKFIELVSKVWATDPERGNKVLATYRAHFKNGAIV